MINHDGEPTMLLRFVEREVSCPISRDLDHAYKIRVLQQLWRVSCTFSDGFPGFKDEWRDVPLEVL